ncbi:MAG TPA: SUMF1/EgtB/PvdO family nonheme iron enzyme [Candidatus Margulisiibacteriota bacterium]|nr:SUMF1/EgtB/PvdO family nonheme iron enzyme [Candidatus Margulisiibacteriota bacterium]
MKRSIMNISLAVGLAMPAATVAAVGFPETPVRRCAPDAVPAGTVCLDKYEASVWRVPDPTTTNAGLVRRIQLGRATQADLTAGGATQLGVFGSDDYSPCADSGQNCANDIYAVSLPGVMPSANLTWFQALAACTNARKRLPLNVEWQAAVAGTPDPGPDNGTTDCNTRKPVAVPTGSRRDCVSSAGAFDMVGNVEEYVADWVPPSTTLCSSWTSGISPTGDAQCLAGAAETGEPAVLTRGGNFHTGLFAGPVAVTAVRPSISFDIIGFRCAR